MLQIGETVECRVKVEAFEGPLDLLLHLIRTQELDIYDIPIAQVTEQYLRYVQLMQDLNISLAGEFLLMAATLIYIKSQMLLPSAPASEDGESPEDPREELVSRLLEYERFKRAAGLLHDRQIIEDSVWPRGLNEFEDEEQGAVSANLFDLVKAFHSLVERYKDQIVLEIEHDDVTLDQKLAELRRLVSVQREFYFSVFLRTPVTRLHLVVTFVALLEMARLREVALYQQEAFQDIKVVAC